MSRTDKDRPFWVKIHDTTLPLIEEHTHHSHYRWALHHDNPDHPRKTWTTHPCDLRDINSPPTRDVWGACCTRDIAHWHSGCRWHPDSPPRWYLRSVWHAPERTRQRDTLREAVKEYNAWAVDPDGEDFDYDYANYQHRYRGQWWWD